MSESAHRSCECGAVYDRSEHIAEAREISSFECVVCGRTIENWNSAWVPRYRFIACPATEIRMTRMTTTPNALGTLTRSQDPNCRPNCPLVQDSPAGFPESWRGYFLIVAG
jgi:hypothetical protein